MFLMIDLSDGFLNNSFKNVVTVTKSGCIRQEISSFNKSAYECQLKLLFIQSNLIENMTIWF